MEFPGAGLLLRGITKWLGLHGVKGALSAACACSSASLRAVLVSVHGLRQHRLLNP